MIIILLNILTTVTAPIFTAILITIVVVNSIIIIIYLPLFLFSMLLILFRDALQIY